MNNEKEVSSVEKVYTTIKRKLRYNFGRDCLDSHIKVNYMMFLMQGYCLSRYSIIAFDDNILVNLLGLNITGTHPNLFAGDLYEYYELEEYQFEAIDVILNNISYIEEDELKESVDNYPIVNEMFEIVKKRSGYEFLPYNEIDEGKMKEFFKAYFNKFTKEEVIHQWTTAEKERIPLKLTKN